VKRYERDERMKNDIDHFLEEEEDLTATGMTGESQDESFANERWINGSRAFKISPIKL
jgi:hypothetical protein